LGKKDANMYLLMIVYGTQFSTEQFCLSSVKILQMMSIGRKKSQNYSVVALCICVSSS